MTNLKIFIEKSKVLLFFFLIGIPVISNSIYVERSHLLLYFLIVLFFYFLFSYKNILKIPNVIPIFFALFVPSVIYAKDMKNSLECAVFLFIYFIFFVIFYHYEYKTLLYKTLLFISVILILYVLLQNFVVYPYILNSPDVSADIKSVIKTKRFLATFALPNIYSFFLLVILYISFMLYRQKKKLSYLLIFLANLILFFLLKTFIAYIIFLFFGLYFLYKKKRNIFYVAFVFFLLSLIVFIKYRGLDSLSSSLFFRYANYVSAINIFVEHPIFGVGLNNFDIFYPFYILNNANIVHNAHSLPLQLFADMGMAGVLAYFFLFFITFKNRKNELKTLLILLFVYFSFDIMFYIPSVAAIFWVLLALNFSFSSINLKRINNKILLLVVLFFFSIFSSLYFLNTPKSLPERILIRSQKELKERKIYSYFLDIYKLKEFYDNKQFKKTYTETKMQIQNK